MRSAPFPPYRGDKDYVFVSYAHKDDAAVFDLIRRLHEKKYRVWYDQGIDAGANWPQTVAEKLLGSRMVLIFLSENAVRSQNCQREINYAVSRRKDMVVIKLDECDVPADMAMQLSVAPVISCADPARAAGELAALLPDSLLGDGVTGYDREVSGKRRARNPWAMVSLVLLVLLAGLSVFAVGSLRGWFSSAGVRQETVTAESGGEVSVTSFQDSVSMEILLRSLNSEYVYLCGSRMVSDASVIVRTPDGWEIRGEAIPRGSVSSLRPFQGKGIRQLALINEKLRSLDGVETMTELTYLDLSGNPVADLSPLRELPALETLLLLDLPEDTDLSVLAELPALRQVYITENMLGWISPLLDAGIDVTVRR